ncbi:hypothetical protein [Acidovorax sp. 100]|uniref:hypothetical protein n=1 Tax=Acidovorax sp. 100 TaxID=2135635 RepID=UPI001F19991E|nr:hypothetical protein [Acidovorax sp. 100]
MKQSHHLRATAAAAIILCSGYMSSAQAALVSSVCEVNGTNVCDAGNPTITPSGVLTIRGYAFDMATGDRPSDPVTGYVLLRNDDTLVNYKLPIQRVESRPDVIADKITGEFTEAQYPVLNAGFVAQVISASLPAGTYSVQEVRVGMKQGLVQSLPLDRAEIKGRFTISDAQSPLKLIQGGNEIPLKMVRGSSGAVLATGYPALRDGPMTIKATVNAGATVAESSVNFTYKRPELAVPVSLPIVQDFPGISTRLAPINPLNNRSLDVAALPVVVDSGSVESLKVNGQDVSQSAAFELPRQANVAGTYPVLVGDSTDQEAARDVRLWVNLPDAPNIVLQTTAWNPASKIKVSQSHTSVAIKVQDADVQAKLEGASKETCNTLSMIRPDYMLSQTAGVNCAIRFGALPEGMKYNPYAANALRGSLPLVGDNTIEYTPGVVYTNPATRQTAFYPVKSGSGSVTIAGTTPSPIALTFKNDKLLDTFYAKNSAQFPGKMFATVDKSQPRSLGIVNVKAGYREITTRVTYPGDSVKEFNSSIPESNVALVMQADTPWAESKVKVESWYQRAPEFKTVQEFDFIGVPQGPLVDFEKTFTSHDQAETTVSGFIGIARGQTVVFEPESMGQWQVTIKDEKSGASMSTAVPVDAEGKFSVNLGRLTAGTRFIVAEARMVNDGAVINSAVTSKSRALVTAAGDVIEATLTARATSGKVPFAQTLNANVKNAKMLANVKAVAWEVLGEDGNWTRVMRTESIEQTGVNYTVRMESVGSATYRAVLVNKYSGAEFKTEPLTLTAFDVPTFTVTAPGVVLVGRPVELKVQAQEGFDASYQWRIITTGGVEQVSGENTPTLTFTPTEIKNYSIEVLGRAASAPDNPAADVKKTIGVKAVNPLAARASLQGPSYVEAGKQYTYKAIINDVVPTTAAKSYEVLGYWMLPDGTRVDGTDLLYTPAPGDKVISYYTYVKGYPEETTAATLSIKTWAYNWPSTWRIKLVPQITDVPAVVKYYVETPDFDLKSLNGEPLSYTWSLPQNVTRSSGSDVAGNLSITSQGTYQLALQVSDTRGNVTNVTSDEFTILPPASVQTQASIVSKYPGQFFAPGSYYLGLKILGMPRGDSFLRNDVLINQTKVGEFTGTGHYVNFQTPGQYEVTVRTITRAGNYGEQALPVEVKDPPKPVCVVKQTSTSSGVLLTPECQVDAGVLRTTTWNYTLDGVAQKATSKSFAVPKAWLGTTRLTDLRVSVDTDLGAITEQPVTIQ